MPPTPFVLLTKSRSGSKWLTELLDSHEDVTAFPELFGGAQVRKDYGADGVPTFEQYVARSRSSRALPAEFNRVAYLKHIHGSAAGTRAVGVKLVYGHVTRGVLGYLAARRVRVLHLVRTNVFDSVLSYEVTKARRFGGDRSGEPLEPVRLHLDVRALRKRLDDHEYGIARARTAIQQWRLPWLDVYYEELVGRRDETLARVLRFLEVAPTSDGLRSTFVPVDGRNVVIENVAEIRDELAGTRFEWMVASRVAS